MLLKWLTGLCQEGPYLEVKASGSIILPASGHHDTVRAIARDLILRSMIKDWIHDCYDNWISYLAIRATKIIQKPRLFLVTH